MSENYVIGSKRVLLISQDRWLVDRLREVLDGAGFETEIALSGAVGATVVLDRRVDLLLADEAVEDFHNVRKIKDPASPTYRLPVVIIAENEKPHKEDVARLIPFAVIPREFDPKELAAQMERAVAFGERFGKRVVA